MITKKRKSGEWTTIPVKKATRDKLKGIGRKDETYDLLLLRLINGEK